MGATGPEGAAVDAGRTGYDVTGAGTNIGYDKQMFPEPCVHSHIVALTSDNIDYANAVIGSLRAVAGTAPTLE